MSAENKKLIGGAEIALAVLLVLQIVVVVFFVVPGANSRLALILIENKEYGAAAKLIKKHDISGSEALQEWIDEDLESSLDSAASGGGERSQNAMELLRQLESHGYDCERPVKNAYNTQKDKENYIADGGVCAVSLVNVLNQKEETVNLTMIVSMAAEKQRVDFLNYVNSYRGKYGAKTFLTSQRLTESAEKIALYLQQNSGSYDLSSLEAYAETVNPADRSLSNYSTMTVIESDDTGLFISRGEDAFGSLTGEQREAIMATDNNLIGIGLAYDPETESFVWFIETASSGG